MTSEYTKDRTLQFFKSHKYFGLNSKNVIVFEQNMFPCLDYEGKIILDQKNRIARAPDGNGGLYTALVNSDYNVLKVHTCLSVCVCLSVCLSVCLYACTCVSVCLSVYL